MKTRVTIELDDDQRVAVGLMETGKMVPASREEIISFVTQVVMATVNVATAVVAEKRQETHDLIVASLEKGRSSE